MDCDDPCWETEASMTLGDMCSDTEPTPANIQCDDPDLSHASSRYFSMLEHSCVAKKFINTPYRNYMSYSGDGCADHFSKQQVARMHCYIDSFHGGWTGTRSPSPVPLTPQVLVASPGSVTITWIPPLGHTVAGMEHICSQCTDDYSFVQYANDSKASVALGFGMFGPEETIGEPDAKSCSESSFTPYAWVPHGNEGACQGDDCSLQVFFAHPVVISRLYVWFPYADTSSVQSIDLVYEDHSVQSLQPIHVHCDKPYTNQLLAEKKRVYKVIIRGADSGFAVDAVGIKTDADDAICKKCPPLKYKVSRTPYFVNEDGTTKSSVMSASNVFTDGSVSSSEIYEYTVHTMLGNFLQSVGSPPLVYNANDSFCGDGVVDRGENCDDGNRRNADGCSTMCKIESSFHCKGEPSLCYRHYGDGNCEENELSSGYADCGHSTPEGYSDYWMVSATAGPGQLDFFSLVPCTPDVVIGQPCSDGHCVQKANPLNSWRANCLLNGVPSAEEDYYLEMLPSQPVVVSAVVLYLATDESSLGGRTYISVSISIMLITEHTEDNEASDDMVVEATVNLTCTMTAHTISILHDLNKPMQQTTAVRLTYASTQLDVYAAAVRKPDWVHSTTVCHDGYFDPTLRQCVSQQTLCTDDACGTVAVKHADVTCTGHREGHTCSVSCKPGYELTGDGTSLVCSGGSWAGNVKCLPVDCGVPDVPYASMDCPDGTTMNNKCKFECTAPARKEGRSQVMVCKKDGLWSLPEGYCRVLCPPISRMKNATLVTETCAGGAQDLGTSCRLRCDKGYRIANTPRMGHILDVTCGANGEWIGPNCEEIHCPSLPPIYSGTYSCSDSFRAGTTCKIKCPGPNGVISQLKCLKTGEWNQAPEACDVAEVSCPSLKSDAMSGLMVDCTNRTAGSECELSCAYPGYDIVSGAGSAMPGGVQVSTLCAYSGHWTPDVHSIQCLPKCDEFFIGDGYCDPNNNQERCMWDGGDCCASTSITGDVISCGPACTCKDPRAVENISTLNRVRRHHKRRKSEQKKKQRMRFRSV